MAYGGVYAAKTVTVEATKIQAYIPQVFGDVLVTVENFLSDVPVASTMGWVSFWGGNAELPVWMGTAKLADLNTHFDARYVNTAGDKMTGELVLPAADPVDKYGAVNADFMHRWINLAVSTKVTKVDEYLTPGTYTWTKPAGAVLIELIMYGGGGGGGGGRSDATSTVRPGGGGGGGAGYTHVTLPATGFRATETVVVAAGGAGGQATNAVMDGASGSAGGTSSISTSTGLLVLASGGSGGDGASATGALIVGGGRGTINGGPGAPSVSDGGAGQPQVYIATGTLNATIPDANLASLSVIRACIGGASGGGITAANVLSVGGVGSVSWHDGSGGAAGSSGVNNGAGGDGPNSPAGLWLPGGGGAGASAFGSSSGGQGGAGGKYGGGGGGGSGKSSGSVVGHGGRGGDGMVAVITHF